MSRLSDKQKWTSCFKIYFFFIQRSSAPSHHIWKRKAKGTRNTEARCYNSNVYFHPKGQAFQHSLELNSQLLQWDFPLAWKILTSLWTFLHSSCMSNRKHYFLILPSVKLCKQNCESKITNAKTPYRKSTFGQWWIEMYGVDIQRFSRQNTCWMHLLGAQWPGWSLLLKVHRGAFQPQSQEVWHGHMPASRGAEMGDDVIPSTKKAMQACGSEHALAGHWALHPSIEICKASASSVLPWWAQHLG